MTGTATLSPCGTYRYDLHRGPDTGPFLAWVMLNPSTADASLDDPTIRRVRSFTAAAGAERFVVVNLFAYRATSPKDLLAAHRSGVDIVGPDNLIHHQHLAEHPDRVGTVAAWGSHGLTAYGWNLLRPVWAGQLVSLGTTRTNAPRHPLYVKGSTSLTPWPPIG